MSMMVTVLGWEGEIEVGADQDHDVRIAYREYPKGGDLGASVLIYVRPQEAKRIAAALEAAAIVAEAAAAVEGRTS